MRKKNFKTSFDTLLESEPLQIKKENGEKEMRATFIVQETSLEKLKAVAYWERKKIKSILEEALSNYFTTYEKEKGVIQLPK